MRERGLWPLLLCAALVAACRQDMHDQPRYKPLAKSEFFGDGRASRPPVDDTVARGHLRDDALLYTGREGAKFSAFLPFAADEPLLARGRERYDIFCAPCHGYSGHGDGMVTRRGFKTKPVSFHEARLREKPVGYFYDVITRGFGAMPDYAAQIPVRDRWAIVAYLRALQLSQNVKVADLPPNQRARVERLASEGTRP